MQIQHNISLKAFNTFGIDVKAKHFVVVTSLDELKEVLTLGDFPNTFILGGGSNMLLTKDIEDLVVHVDLKGIEVQSENDTHVTVKAMAGENWHAFVLWCLEQNYGGIENLSLIPGNVGTAPIQNIGAYGVELKDVFESCEVLELETNTVENFNKIDCQFGYRDSIFKQKKKGKYIIVSVTFNLTKTNHILYTEYGAINSELQNMNIYQPSIQDVSNAIITIRQSKLPDPNKIGNCGSFFKNPIISIHHFETLKKSFPEIPGYPVSEDKVKIPAGWLIETAGFKGKTFENYGVHKNQALVLVNYGGAKGRDILKLARLIQKTIIRIFEVTIETEVNII